MSTQKELAGKAYLAKDYETALTHYAKAIEEAPTDHTLYSNRSATYHAMGNFQKALEDAEKSIEVKPDWAKGFLRKGMAMEELGN